MVGVVDASRDAVDVVLDAAPMGDRLRLLLDGKPLLHADFLASDLSTDDGIQTYTDAVELDAEGRAPSEWLIVGHRYYFRVSGAGVPGGARSGFVRWSGQPTIEITQLSMTKDLE